MKKNKKTSLIIVLIIIVVVMNITYAFFSEGDKQELANTSSSGDLNITIDSETAADSNLIAMYQENENGEYEKIDIIPSSGYIINEEKSYCEVNKKKVDTITIGYKEDLLYIGNITKKGTKCYLYFDEQVLASSTILADKTISTRSSFSSVYTTATTNTLFKAQDDDGDSYYYAGAATDNYVSFAGFYWRIIRINGDGSVRLIYDGTSARSNGTSSSATQIGKSAFNSSSGNNMYVGYMYTSGSVHGLGTSSTIKGTLDNWFTSNLSDYTSYLDYNAGFCGDRQPSTSSSTLNGSGGTGTTTTYYAAYIRLYTNKTPDLKCAESSDLYTTSSSGKGNKSLTYPIGLITADEVAYAGGVYVTSNSKYYLYTGQHYWTMSPYYYYSSLESMFSVYSSGYLGYFNVSSAYGVRPVINLRSDVTFSGEGSMDSPYVVEK